MKVLMNKLFNGSLQEICHEMMDFFKTDNDQHFLYIVNDGVLAQEHEKKGNEVDCVLLVEPLDDDRQTVHVIAKATGLTTMAYHRRDNDRVEDIRDRQTKIGLGSTTKYGGVSINKLFKIIPDKPNAWVTFKANEMHRPTTELFFTNKTELIDKNNFFFINTTLDGTSQKLYFDDSRNIQDFEIVRDIINNPSLWEKDDFYKKYDTGSAALSQKDPNILNSSYIVKLEKFASDIKANQPN